MYNVRGFVSLQGWFSIHVIMYKVLCHYKGGSVYKYNVQGFVLLQVWLSIQIIMYKVLCLYKYGSVYKL